MIGVTVCYLFSSKVVVALSDTVRRKAEMEEAIESPGGWPGAFAS